MAGRPFYHDCWVLVLKLKDHTSALMKLSALLNIEIVTSWPFVRYLLGQTDLSFFQSWTYSFRQIKCLTAVSGVCLRVNSAKVFEQWEKKR